MYLDSLHRNFETQRTIIFSVHTVKTRQPPGHSPNSGPLRSYCSHVHQWWAFPYVHGNAIWQCLTLSVSVPSKVLKCGDYIASRNLFQTFCMVCSVVSNNLGGLASGWLKITTCVNLPGPGSQVTVRLGYIWARAQNKNITTTNEQRERGQALVILSIRRRIWQSQ